MRIRNVRDVQIGMYDHCLTSFGGRHEWLMMFDSDEFLYLKDVQTQQMEAETAQGGMHYPLHTFLQQYEDYAALGVNWVLYGSNGHQTRPQGRFIQCLLMYCCMRIGWCVLAIAIASTCTQIP